MITIGYECGGWFDRVAILASCRPNVFPAKLQRQGPRAEAARRAACYVAPRSAAREDVRRRTAVRFIVERGASAPARSRALPTSAGSWTAPRHLWAMLLSSDAP